MGIRPEHLGFEQLPAPVAIARDGQLLYANPALAQLLGTERPRLVGLSVAGLMANFLGEGEHAWVDALHDGQRQGGAGGAPAWVSVRTVAGERSYRVQLTEGPAAGERLYLLLDAEGEAVARRLTEALAAAAGGMFRCRTDWDVLDAAVEVIAQQGFTAAVLLIEGEELVHGPLRQEPEQLAAAERLYGMPMQQVRFRLSGMPHLKECFARRRGAFYNDLAAALAGFHSPEVLKLITDQYPAHRGVDAPIFVNDEPFATIGVQGVALTPSSAATLELFARQVGAALENVRHHRSATEQVTKLARLQAELVASERLAAVGEAAAVVAHEIRNPVGAILNAVALLKRDSAAGSSENVVGMLEEEALRLEHLVGALLAYTGRLEPRLRPVVLGEVARRVAQLLASRNALGEVRLEVIEQGVGGPLVADADLLELALINLALNAIQASPPGATVLLRAVSEPQGGRLIVEDQGSGIPAADAGRIFDPFFTTRARGSGLGLAVVSRVVGAHRGQVVVGRTASGGARFEIRLGSCSA